MGYNGQTMTRSAAVRMRSGIADWAADGKALCPSRRHWSRPSGVSLPPPGAGCYTGTTSTHEGEPTANVSPVGTGTPSRSANATTPPERWFATYM